VIDANVAALKLFPIDVKRLPLGIVEATREANLVTAVNSHRPKGDVRLTHGRRLVEVQVVSGPREDTQVVYVTDVTELRRLESVRQEFVANLAHELKTPITSLRLAVESQQQDMPSELRRRMSDRALREVDYLSLVISNLRQLSALDSSMGTSSPERFDVALLLDEVRERLRLKQPVKVSVPPGLWANADRARIAQALANLIDNASKFSPPDTPIEVSAVLEHGDLVFCVRDHGPGISPEHWNRVFERFYKVDQAHSRVGTGSGLGLSLVRHLALSMEGSVWTEAAEEGGQIFGIRVPSPGERQAS
jgi:two-component system phosphate regulon sensor histidine kinase PhoR